MRLSAHSIRLAVSLLLGAVFVAPPMASTVSAATLDPLHQPLSVNQPENTCPSIIPNNLSTLYLALTPPRFERVDETIPNAVVITQPNDLREHSLTPAKTVLTKITEDDIQEITPVTPTPEPEPIIPSVTPTESVTTTLVAAASDSTQVSSGGLSSEVLFNLVNAARTQAGLAPFEQDERICSLAATRAPEVDGEIYITHNMHAGFWGRKFPYWSTENVISMRTEQEALNWWLNSPVHRGAILGSWKYACVKCSGNACSMIFTNFESKVAVPQVTPTAVAL